MPVRSTNADENQTVSRIVADITARFATANLETPRLDARVLVAHVLGLEPSQLFARADTKVPPAVEAALETLVRRRAAHEPVSRIIGRREFWGLDFALTPDTLDPRADTETVVSAVLAARHKISAKAPRILDLGTGTGCILLAILKDWPQASGLGIDASPGAVAAAQANAGRLGFAARAAFRRGDWCAGLAEQFDVIVSNPPYIAESELPALAPEVTLYDPALALTGGADGLEAYRSLLPNLGRHLSAEGRVFLEIGARQGPAVAGLMAVNGFGPPGEHRDLAGIVRCLEAITV